MCSSRDIPISSRIKLKEICNCHPKSPAVTVPTEPPENRHSIKLGTPIQCSASLANKCCCTDHLAQRTNAILTHVVIFGVHTPYPRNFRPWSTWYRAKSNHSKMHEVAVQLPCLTAYPGQKRPTAPDFQQLKGLERLSLSVSLSLGETVLLPAVDDDHQLHVDSHVASKGVDHHHHGVLADRGTASPSIVCAFGVCSRPLRYRHPSWWPEEDSC